MKIQSLFLGNWKMNMRPAEVVTFAKSFLEIFQPLPGGAADTGFAPPFTTIAAVREALASKPGILVGAQNAHWLDTGAQTGEVSVPMLADQGVNFVIVGHSERRQFYGENDRDVSRRAKAVITHGLTAVICIGETKDQFEAGQTTTVVSTQLKGSLADLTVQDCPKIVIAYEPVWAIGTGLAATPEIASNVHDEIRKQLCSMFGQEAGSKIAILYGGSATPQNIAELMAKENINGALVGGASLKPDVFNALITNGRAAKAN